MRGNLFLSLLLAIAATGGDPLPPPPRRDPEPDCQCPSCQKKRKSTLPLQLADSPLRDDARVGELSDWPEGFEALVEPPYLLHAPPQSRVEWTPTPKPPKRRLSPAHPSEVTCPSCGALAGAPCHKSNGVALSPQRMHPARKDALRVAINALMVTTAADNSKEGPYDSTCTPDALPPKSPSDGS